MVSQHAWKGEAPTQQSFNNFSSVIQFLLLLTLNILRFLSAIKDILEVTKKVSPHEQKPVQIQQKTQE